VGAFLASFLADHGCSKIAAMVENFRRSRFFRFLAIDLLIEFWVPFLGGFLVIRFLEFFQASVPLD
jgi:hypothetical protein